VGERAKDLGEETLEPESLFHAMCCGDVLALHGGEQDNLLLLQ